MLCRMALLQGLQQPVHLINMGFVYSNMTMHVDTGHVNVL